ncbi:MAG: hypothetical protein JWO63_2531, partial [Frankiales bacterium]|nr:hypothetical protein [Frankiales bacterium]
LDANEVLVRGQNVGDDVGYLVLTPFKTNEGVLLVARGFISQTQQAADTPVAPPAPTGTVTITARLRPAATRADRLGSLPSNQVLSINVADQQTRLRLPVWDGYGELLGGQAGSAGLTVIPGPDLSNPAGGAAVPQHAAYVVQWYLFGGLALALPFVLAAAERRRDLSEQTEGTSRGDATPTGPSGPRGPDRPNGPSGPKGPAEPLAARPSALQAAKSKRAARNDRLAGNR